ncbi:hypothetical protein FRC10_001942 [Ceratobasidium sp. 414]|nr:hypothetical protein FRC10_001942 [Ceratobasidium sp. 414]
METGKDIFPADAVARARELYEEIGSIDAYSHSQGVPFIWENVTKFIAERDGYPSDPSQISLTVGASAGVSFSSTCSSPHPTPVSSSRSRNTRSTAPHSLNTVASQSHTILTGPTAAVSKTLKDGIEPKALVVINPGNPTGSVLDEDTMRALLKICEGHPPVLLADEVYQANTHNPQNHPFTSFKKILRETQSPIPLVSFHSISKGVSGECGRRGGYFELTNVGVDSPVPPPKEGSESYLLWKKETDTIHTALAKRSRTMCERLNSLPGMSCAPSPGALYLFPQLHLTNSAIKAAKDAGMTPDNFYSNELLDKTGICAVSGSGFGQTEGEAHFRLTACVVLSRSMWAKLERFHGGFMEKYKD